MPKEKITPHGRIIYTMMGLSGPGYLLGALATPGWADFGHGLMMGSAFAAAYALTSNKPLSIKVDPKKEVNWCLVAKLEHYEGISHVHEALEVCDIPACRKLWREYEKAAYPETDVEIQELTLEENTERIRRKVDEMALGEAIEELKFLEAKIAAPVVSVSEDDLLLRNELEATLKELLQGMQDREAQQERPIDSFERASAFVSEQMVRVALSPIAQVMATPKPSPISEYLTSGLMTPSECRQHYANQHVARRYTEQERWELKQKKEQKLRAEANDAINEYKKNPDGDPLRHFTTKEST